MISNCYEGTVTADSGTEIKKEKSSGRRGKGKLGPRRSEPGKKKKRNTVGKIVFKHALDSQKDPRVCPRSR